MNEDIVRYDETHDIPQRLIGIEVGDVVQIRNIQSIRYFDAHHQRRGIRCGWNHDMDYLTGRTVTISPDMMANIRACRDQIFRIDGWNISLDMLEFAHKSSKEKGDDILAGHEEMFSLKEKALDDNIIKEMISKVDINRFKKLLVIGGHSSGFCLKHIDDRMVEAYLKLWAKSKYEFYLLFGKNLSMQKEIETEITDMDMGIKMTDLCYSFPKYAPVIVQFDSHDFINNVCGNNFMFAKFYKTYNPNEKLTGFFANLLQDKEFNDTLAGVLSNRMIKAKLSISIDPYDYLTMSLNGYDWESCQRIGRGSYSTGTLSLMLDDSTLIAFKHNGAEQIYNINNYKFSGNSKSWRQCIYVDKNSSSIIFSRQYPVNIEMVEKEVRKFLEDKIAEYKNIKNAWVISSSVTDGYVSGSSCLFHDAFGGHRMRKATLKEKDNGIKEKFVVGKDIYCPICGTKLSGSGESFLCNNCRRAISRLSKEDLEEYVENRVNGTILILESEDAD